MTGALLLPLGPVIGAGPWVAGVVAGAAAYAIIAFYRGHAAPSRARLEDTLEGAEERADRAEELAGDLEEQAVRLEEQTVELETLNDELRVLEERMRAIIDSALDAIVVADQNSVVTEWNRPAESMFGWSSDDAVGRRLNDLIIPPAHREAHDRGMRHYLATGEGPILNRRIEVTALRKDGTEFPVELTVAPTRWGSTPMFASFIRDLTDRKQVERRLTAEHAVTRVLAGAERLQDAAPRILEALGTTLGWDFGAFWTIDPDRRVLRPVATWHCSECDPGDFATETRNATFRPGEGLPGKVWEEKEATWVADVAAETTFPRAARAALVGLHGAFAFPVMDGKAVVGVVDFFHREVLTPNQPLLDMVVAVGSDIGQALRRMRAEEERDRALSESARANDRLRETNQALAEQSQAAERARRAADEANQAKSEFLANMSHELRTPLNAILGYADLLDMEIPGPITDAQRTQLGRVRVSSQHLLSLIEDILDIAKVEAGRLGVEVEESTSAEVAAGALSLVGPQAAERGLHLENLCAEPTIRYVGDSDRVRQILANLLSNAIKFTEPGGKVTVRCDVTSTADRDALLSGSGPWARIQVEDTGIGIAPQDQATIFDPFIQAEQGRTRTRGGTGLGLTISRQLARLMGGDLTVRSERGEGSCFTLWLLTSSVGAGVDAVQDEGAQGFAGFATVGEALLHRVVGVNQAVCARLRSDPDVPSASSLPQAELEDHQLTYLADVAQTLVLADNGGAPADLLRDGSDIQRLAATRHGLQRARHRWTEEELHREFEILAEEMERAAREVASTSPVLEPAVRLIRRLISQGEQVSLRGLRTAAVTAARK